MLVGARRQVPTPSLPFLAPAFTLNTLLSLDTALELSMLCAIFFCSLFLALHMCLIMIYIIPHTISTLVRCCTPSLSSRRVMWTSLTACSVPRLRSQLRSGSSHSR